MNNVELIQSCVHKMSFIPDCIIWITTYSLTYLFIIWYESSSYEDPPLVYQFLIEMMQFHLRIWLINLKIKIFWCSLNDPQMHFSNLDIPLVCRPIKLMLEILLINWVTALILNYLISMQSVLNFHYFQAK